MNNKINLHKYRSQGSKLFSGRDRGCEAREILNLDDLDNSKGSITVSIPKDTWAINSSFFGGLFEDSIIKLGEKKFREKYKFVFDDGSELTREIMGNIDEGIFDASNDI